MRSCAGPQPAGRAGGRPQCLTMLVSSRPLPSSSGSAANGRRRRRRLLSRACRAPAHAQCGAAPARPEEAAPGLGEAEGLGRASGTPRGASPGRGVPQGGGRGRGKGGDARPPRADILPPRLAVSGGVGGRGHPPPLPMRSFRRREGAGRVYTVSRRGRAVANNLSSRGRLEGIGLRR